jgi:hypothetical protein
VKEDDDVTLALANRMARPRASGGAVIERAAFLAEGVDFASVIAWIADRDAQPETRAAAVSTHGLHASRLTNTGAQESRSPLRYVPPRER